MARAGTLDSAIRLVRKGIVAQATVRIAAGGVVAASLLILGPLPAQAVADKHGSDSHSKHNDQGNHSNKPGSDRGGPRDGLSAVGGAKPSTDPPQMNLGTVGSDLGELAIPDSVETFAVADGPVALRSAAVEDVPSGHAAGAVPRSGSAYAAPPTAAIRAPRVVIGDGRTPRPQPGAAEPVFAPAIPEVLPPQPTAIEINMPPLPPPLPPTEKFSPPRLVETDIGTAGLDTVTDPLAGLAGLILLPAVGAVLGFRQARAAQALRGSTRT